MSTTLYWLRHDLRLHDNPRWRWPARGAEQLLPVLSTRRQDEASPWGFARVGAHPPGFLSQALAELARESASAGQ